MACFLRVFIDTSWKYILILTMAFMTLLIESCVLLLLNKVEDLEVIVAKLAILSHLHGTSSHQHDDDDDDVETSRASTPSPTTY
ncbi:hypothetical protein Tco_0074227, partial [Tanacetum coccineum]